MKTLKLSTVATALCLLCMSMGFPNLATEEDEQDCSEKKGKARTTCVRTVAMACTRQVNVSTKPVAVKEVPQTPFILGKAQPLLPTITGKIGGKKTA